MKNIEIEIERVANGYTVTVHPSTEEASHCVHIAPTQKEVAEVVRGICRGAFDEKGGDDEQSQ